MKIRPKYGVGFRVARRAYPQGLEIEPQADAVLVSCAHDWYRRLKGRPIHKRTWRLTESSLIVTDTIEGHYQSAKGCIHFHPNVRLSVEKLKDQGELLLLGGKKIHWQLVNASASLVSSTYHPEFGMSIPNQCLEYRFLNSKASITFSWD